MSVVSQIRFFILATLVCVSVSAFGGGNNFKFSELGRNLAQISHPDEEFLCELYPEDLLVECSSLSGVFFNLELTEAQFNQGLCLSEPLRINQSHNIQAEVYLNTLDQFCQKDQVGYRD